MRRIAALVALILALGCTREGRPSGAARQTSPTPPAGAPADGGHLVRRLEADVTTLNPLSGQGVSTHQFAKYVFTPLLYVNERNEPVAGLATRWTPSADGLTYEFSLNQKATFSDGTPVRARDVIFTLGKIRDPSSRASAFSSFEHLDLRKTKATDDHTVRVVFHRAIAGQLEQFALVYVLPEHFYAKRDFLRDCQFVALGSGPYTLVRRTGKTIVLQRRPTYWRERPHIEKVTLEVLPDYTAAWQALVAGEVDETYVPSTIWPRARQDPKLTRYLTFTTFFTFQYNCVIWNTRHPLLRDPTVRRALAMSIPAETVAHDLYAGAGRAITGPFTPDHPGYDGDLTPTPYAPEEARRLLASAGWQDRDGDGVLDKDGRPFILDVLTPEQKLASVLKDYLGKIGVSVDIESGEFTYLQDALQHGRYAATVAAWTLDHDPDLYPIFHSSQIPPRGKNYNFYGNPTVDRLIEEARQERDPVKRQRLQRTLHATIASAYPNAFAIEVPSNWGINKRVQGVKIAPGTGLFFWYPGELGWWIAPEQH